MDDINKNTNTSDWVHDRLAQLSPSQTWEPVPERGLVHLRSYERMANRRQSVQRTAALATLIVCAVVLVVPTTRGIARQLLDRFYMRRPDAVRSGLPRTGQPALKVEYTTLPTSHFVASLAEAEQEAGFKPWLPPMLIGQIDSGLTVQKVRGPMNARIRIRVDDLRAALLRLGIEGVNVPQNWDGVDVGYQLGPGILVAFEGGTLEQALPPSIVTPPGFLLIDFTNIALRIAGLSASDAYNSRHMFAESGGAFSIVPADAKSTFRQVSLKSGYGLFFENHTSQDERQKCSFCPGPHERSLTWAALDHIFQLRSTTMTMDQLAELANSIN